jgi:hypothetical protein
MKIILYLIAVISLLSTTGCIFPGGWGDDRGRGGGGHDDHGDHGGDHHDDQGGDHDDHH